MNAQSKIPAAKETTDLVAMKPLTAALVFIPGGVDAILDKIENEVRSFKPDISTQAGRTAIASLAYKVARSKTALDEMGKDLVGDWKAKASAVDAERRIIRERLDSLKDEIRKPLTDWENADKLRIEAHEKAILDLHALLDFGGEESTAAQLQERIDIFAARPVRQWEEFVQRASEAAMVVGKRLEDMHKTAVTRETERAELERLRAEQIAREQKERDERIAAEAAERNRLASIEAERKRVSDAKAAEDAATAKREADKKHRAKVNGEARDALIAAGLSAEQGTVAVTAIAKGEVPHIRISY